MEVQPNAGSNEEMYQRYKVLIKKEKNMDVFLKMLADPASINDTIPKISPAGRELLLEKFSKSRTFDPEKQEIGILHMASKYGFMPLVSFISNQCKHEKEIIDMVNKVKRTPLMVACKYNQIDAVKTLIEQGGANVHYSCENGTPFLSATESKNIDLLTYLLDTHSVDVNSTDSMGTSPLYVAVYTGSLEMVKFLLDKGCNPYIKGTKESTVLHICAERGFADVCREILKREPNLVYESDAEGNTPLHIACEWSYIEVIEALFEIGGAKLAAMKNNDGLDAVEFSYAENQHEPYVYLCNKLGIRQKMMFCKIF